VRKHIKDIVSAYEKHEQRVADRKALEESENYALDDAVSLFN